MGEGPHGVLLMAYGTPERTDDLESYYTDIRRGRPPTPEQLADLRRRYDAIGGLSPLAERTRAQVAGLQRTLDSRHPGHFHVELGLKHADPKIEDGMQRLLDLECQDLTYLVLAPHYSALSVGQYLERADAVAERRRSSVFRSEGRPATASPLPVEAERRKSTRSAEAASAEAGTGWVTEWYAAPKLIALLADRVRTALGKLPEGARAEVLVTAHSLPLRALEIDDPTYEEQLRRTGELIAKAAGLPSWRIAWQSAGRTPEPWIGPDIGDVIRSLPAEGFDAVVVCPAGFTSDHLEVLYDIDIEAKGVAEEVGLRLERTESLNDDPQFLGLLADLVSS